MRSINSKCNEYLDLDMSDVTDFHSYHDTQTCFMFHCELEKEHEGLHMVTIKGQEIFWVDD